MLQEIFDDGQGRSMRKRTWAGREGLSIWPRLMRPWITRRSWVTHGLIRRK